MTLLDELKKRSTFLTTKEVMELLHLRRNTVCDWVKTGRIPAILTPSGYRFDPGALAGWLEARTSRVARRVA